MDWLLNMLRELLASWEKKKNPEPVGPVPKPEPPVVVPVPEPPKENIGVREKGQWFGRHNGGRGTWYFAKLMRQYPKEFYIEVPGCLQRTLVKNNGSRWELGGQGGYVIKQSDVPGRKMALIVPAGCRSRECFIYY